MQKRSKPKNRAHAAMEFLMTYGWAIMVVLVAIGVLSYFGVLSQDKFVPRRCALEPGIGCVDFKADESSVILVLINGKGEDITISSINISNCGCTVSGFLGNGKQSTFKVGGCNNEINKKFIGEVNIDYTINTGLAHKHKGSVISKVEASNYLAFGLDSGDNTWIQSNNFLNGMRFQNTIGDGTLTKLEILFDDPTPTNSVKLGVYADSNGDQGALLLDAGEAAVADGWVGISGLCLPVTNGAYYWLSYVLEDVNNVVYQTGRSANSHCWALHQYNDPLSDPFPDVIDCNTNQYTLRATVIPASIS